MTVANETTTGAPPGEARLSLARIEGAARHIDPAFLNSPQFVSEPLSIVLGCRLTLKIESLNPLRCFKGRGADFFVASLPDAPGEAPPLVCASAGNFGQALAYACRRRGLSLTVFVPEGANPLKVERMRALGATVRPAGRDLDAAKAIARRWAVENGARFVEDGREAAIAEGAGTIAIELLARGDAFDDVLVPLGNGALLTGVGRWLKAAAPATRVIGVSSQGASAMADSWRLGPGAPPVEHPDVDTIADGIAVRVPIAEAVADMHGVVDDVRLVGDDDLVRAMRLLLVHAGLVVEPAGAAGLAAVLADAPAFAGRRVAVVIGGGNVAPADLAALFGPAVATPASSLPTLQPERPPLERQIAP
jgi:threonine dehydratase